MIKIKIFSRAKLKAIVLLLAQPSNLIVYLQVTDSLDVGADVKLYKAVSDYIQDLENKRVDVIIYEQLLINYNIKENDLPLKIASEIVNKDEIGMAVNKGNEYFIVKVNKALGDMKENGTFNEIHKKWFGTEPLDS